MRNNPPPTQPGEQSIERIERAAAPPAIDGSSRLGSCQLALDALSASLCRADTSTSILGCFGQLGPCSSRLGWLLGRASFPSPAPPKAGPNCQATRPETRPVGHPFKPVDQTWSPPGSPPDKPQPGQDLPAGPSSSRLGPVPARRQPGASQAPAKRQARRQQLQANSRPTPRQPSKLQRWIVCRPCPLSSPSRLRLRLRLASPLILQPVLASLRLLFSLQARGDHRTRDIQFPRPQCLSIVTSEAAASTFPAMLHPTTPPA